MLHRVVPAAVAAVLGLAAAGAIVPVQAADNKADPVVASVNGTEIHRSQVEEAYKQSGIGQQASFEVAYPQILDYVITGRILVNEAHKEKLEDDPAVKAAFREAEDGILAQSYLRRRVDAVVTDAELHKRYEEYVKALPPKEEVHARHILLKTEAEAKKVIAALKKGAKFADEAKAKSIDPSAKQNGGDLGYFTADEMVPEFAKAAFEMKVGEISPKPVKTQFGWHVIQVEDRRAAKPPSFEDAKAQILSHLRNEEAQKVIEALKTGVKIARFNLDGTPMTEAPAKPANPHTAK